jgi:hypothetical protein
MQLSILVPHGPLVFLTIGLGFREDLVSYMQLSILVPHGPLVVLTIGLGFREDLVS